MKKLLVLLMMVSLPAFAQVSTNGLSAEQKAALDAQAAQMRLQNAATSTSNVPDPDKMEQWVDLGTKIGQGLGGAAKEVGVAVNEFVKTPVGILTSAVILWKFLGSTFLHLFGGIMVLVSGWLFMLYINNKKTGGTITYDPEKRDIFGRAVKVKVQKGELEVSDWAVSYFWMAAITILSLVTIFTA